MLMAPASVLVYHTTVLKALIGTSILAAASAWLSLAQQINIGMLLTANADATSQITVNVIKINTGIQKHVTAAANLQTYKVIAIALITLVEELNTGTLYNANVYALSQVLQKQLANRSKIGSILSLVHGLQNHSHVLPATIGTLLQKIACASNKHAQPHTHGPMNLANANAIPLLMDQMLI